MKGSSKVELLGRAIAQTTWLPRGSMSETESGERALKPALCGAGNTGS